MLSTSYLNFDLLITRSGDAYRAYVIDAPGGDADTLFQLPFSPDEIGRLVLGTGTRRHLRPRQEQAVTPIKLHDVGQQLFDAVFRENVRSLLVSSVLEAKAVGYDLRIRLRFSDDAINLASLPWEILFDREQQHFLALSESRPILRYLSLPRPRPALVIQPPLSILVVLASPTDHAPLNVEQEWQAMETALASLCADSKVSLERLETPTFDALRRRLLGEPVHVLHFVGHGLYERNQEQGLLLFEDAGGRGHVVPANALALLLHNHPSLRLVYLNACEGAIAGQGNVFTGVAQTLVQQGVPAAVAMQAEITDAAAIRLASTFYRALATGRPVDAALTHARVALAASENDEWAIPVLFSRSPDNRLFNIVDVLPTPDCPYPGMRPFSEEQQDLFYGRGKEIDEAGNRLAQHPFLTVVGPSGSGKSSLVYAGIIPFLKESRRFSNGKWTVHSLRPSDRRTDEGKAAPMRALAQALDVKPEGLSGGQGLAPLQNQTLLVVDQLEEAFTQADADETKQFLAALYALIGRPNLYILLTVRADFYPEMMTMGSLWEAVKANRLELTPLGDDELWSAIVEPAAKVGVTVEDALAVAIIADAAGESGVLPLVQETLVLLWDKVEKRDLKLDAYRQMADGHRSGLQAAIDRWANHVYHNQLPAQARLIARRIFLRLIQFGQGRADTRRQQTVEELRASGDNPALFAETLAILTQSRLLTMSGEANLEGDVDAADQATRQVDISHEALITGWGLLRGWITEQREAENTRRRLEDKATEWLNSARQGGLLNQFEMREAEMWLAGPDAAELGVSDSLMQLVDASQADLQAQAAARRRIWTLAIVAVLTILGLVIVVLIIRDRGQQDLLDTQATAATQAANDAAKLAMRATAVATAVIAAETNAAVASYQKATAVAEATRALNAEATAQSEARRAQANALAASAQTELVSRSDPSGSLALLLAKEAVLTTLTIDGIVTINADTALRRAIDEATTHRHRLPRHRHTAWALSVVFSPDGKIIVSASGDSIRQVRDYTVRLWSVATGEEIRTLEGHTDSVNSAIFSPNGQTIVSAGNDQTVRLWNATTGEEIRTLEGHTDRANSAVFSPDGQTIVSASDDQTVRLWNAVTGEEIRILVGHTSSVLTAAFSPDGQTIVSASDDQTVRLWNAATGEEIRTLMGHASGVNSAVFSPDGQTIVSASGDSIRQVKDYTVRLWNAHTGEIIRILEGHTDSVNSAAFSPDGATIVSVSDDQTVRLWNTETGAEIRTLEGHTSGVNSAAFSPDGATVVSASDDQTMRLWNAVTGAEIRTLKGHTADVNSATFSLDGQTIVSASDDQTVRLWNAVTGAEIRILVGHTSSVLTAAFSPDGQTIVSASDDQTIRIWNAQTGAEIRTIKGHTSGVNSAVFSPDGATIVSASDDQTVRLWNTETGAEIRTLKGHTSGVNSAVFNPDGATVVSASDDQTVRLWNAQTGAEIRALKGHTSGVNSAVFSPDGATIISVSGDIFGSNDDTVRLWNAATGAAIHTLEGYTSGVNSAAFSPDGKSIVSASWDGTVRLWNAATGAMIRILEGHTAWVLSAAFSPDGATIVSASGDQTVRLWNAKTGVAVRTIEGHTDWVLSAAFSPDGKTIVSASGNSYGSNDKTVRLWDAETGEELLTLVGHTEGVNSAAFSPDGATIVSASNDRTVQLWSAQTGEAIRTLKGHTWSVLSAAFSPDGATIVSASGDRTVQIWNAKTGAAIRTLKGHTDSVWSAVFSPDGQTLVSASDDQTVRLWNATTGEELRTLAGHTDGVHSAAFSPDGATLVSASGDRTVRLWNAQTGAAIRTLVGHTDSVWSAVFSPDGQTIVSASEDQTVRLWNAQTGAEMRTIEGHTAPVFSAAFSPDGVTIVSASGDQTVRLWIVSLDEMFSLAEQMNPREPAIFTPAERERYGITKTSRWPPTPTDEP